jgi:hypothetical protein
MEIARNEQEDTPRPNAEPIIWICNQAAIASIQFAANNKHVL